MKTLETIVMLLLSLAFIASQINIIRYACTEYKRSKQVKQEHKEDKRFLGTMLEYRDGEGN